MCTCCVQACLRERAPTHRSIMTVDVDAGKAKLRELMAQRDALEREATALSDRLTAPGQPGLTGGLIDKDVRVARVLYADAWPRSLPQAVHSGIGAELCAGTRHGVTWAAHATSNHNYHTHGVCAALECPVLDLHVIQWHHYRTEA